MGTLCTQAWGGVVTNLALSLAPTLAGAVSRAHMRSRNSRGSANPSTRQPGGAWTSPNTTQHTLVRSNSQHTHHSTHGHYDERHGARYTGIADLPGWLN
jgi:hypothetical protein